MRRSVLVKFDEKHERCECRFNFGIVESAFVKAGVRAYSRRKIEY